MTVAAAQTLSTDVIQTGNRFLPWGPKTTVTFSVVRQSGAAEPTEAAPKMSFAEYFALARHLVQTGVLERKHEKVFAFDLVNVAVGTQQHDAAAETLVDALKSTDRVLVFDSRYFRSAAEARRVVERIFRLYGEKMTSRDILDALNRGDRFHCVVQAPGIWTVERAKFFAKEERGEGHKGDYVGTGQPNEYRAKPGTGRVIAKYLGVARDMIFKWKGGFQLRPQADVACFFDEVPDLIERIKKVEAAGGTEEAIKQHLCTQDAETGEWRAVIDIYGMMPGFREANYRPYSRADRHVLTAAGAAAADAMAAEGNPRPLLPARRSSLLTAAA